MNREANIKKRISTVPTAVKGRNDIGIGGNTDYRVDFS